MKKYIIVRSNRLNTFGNSIDEENVKVVNMFSTMNKTLEVCKEILLKFRLRLPVHFYNQQLIDVDADTIIVFDGHARVEFLMWLKKNNKGKRIILWLWNTVNEIGNNLLLSKVPEGIEVWSYSKYDCEKYRLNYNTTFYWGKYTTLCFDSLKNDLYFVGKDKGRLDTIKNIEGICRDLKIKYLFQVVKTHKYSLSKKEYCTALKYEEVQKNIAESRAILDVKVSPTAGPSLRPLEATFYKKKLVTDDINSSSFRFYRRENIFILGVDDNSKLKDFIYSNYSTVDDEDIQFYNVKNWLSRFE